MHQSTQLLVDDPAKLNERRLELGHMGRQLAARPEVLEKIGDWAGFLILEEAKALLAAGEGSQGWESIKEARSFGFDQPRLLYLAPEFEPIVQDTDRADEIEIWLAERIGKELGTFEPFKF